MKRLFKIIGWTILSVVLLTLLAITAMLWYLTPEKLTPIVEQQVSEQIDGRLEAQRIELTFWSSFPRFELDIDSLTLISDRLSLPDDSLRIDSITVNPNILLSVKKLHGAINLPLLLKNKIELYDLLIEKPQATIVINHQGIANYDIFSSSASADSTDIQNTTTRLPDISINHFTIKDAGPLTYYSLRDSIYLSASILNTKLDSNGKDAYSLNISGNALSPMLDEYNLKPLSVAINGRIKWSPTTPAKIELKDTDIAINELNANLNTIVDATGQVTIPSFALTMDSVKVNDLLNHLPANMATKFRAIDTDMTIGTHLKLLQPYTVTDSITIPSVEINVNIPECHFYWNDLHLNKAILIANATIDGNDLDNSHVKIDKLLLDGRTIYINASGTADGPIDNPVLDSHLNMALRLGRLPLSLREKLPVKVSGQLSADTDVRMRLRDMNIKDFHRVYLDGQVKLTDFDLTSYDSLLYAHTEHATLDFGTDRTVQGQEQRVDSMLTASIKIDTLSLVVPGLTMSGSDFSAGLGVLNRSTSSDTTTINPFGGVVMIKSMIVNQPADSLTIRLRDMSTMARLTRYKGNSKAPLLHFDLNARRIGTRMPDMALSISQPNIILDAHLITRDSAVVNTRRHYRVGIDSIGVRTNLQLADSTIAPEAIDWNLNNDLKTLIKRWDINGHLTSNRAFIFTRDFPLRQRAADIDLFFSTDTVKLNNLQYSIGNTRLGVKGEVTNIERALAGNSKQSKLKIRFDISAPFIDINELATTTFYESSGNAGPDPDYDENFDNSNTAVTTDTTSPRPVLIPRNINAELTVNADTIKYADLLMDQFSGTILINNNAINLHDLNASTDIGSASFSALYWAPDTANMHLSMGLKLNRFHIDRVLSLIPAVDSLLPALQEFAGIINADLAATTAITPSMDIDMPSFKGAMKIDGDSLVLLDADTFKMLAKWLIFKNKKRNMIDHMDVEIAVEDNTVQIYPFIFDIDRYKLGVMGHNDLDMNLDYHVSVLKSPLPFKFGINIKGNLDNPKIRLGGAKIKPGQALSYNIADSTRLNLLTQIEDMFKRGSISNQSISIKNRRKLNLDEMDSDTLSAGDSLIMQQEGYLPAPDSLSRQQSDTIKVTEQKKKKLFPWIR